ncbi:hypothetical protein QEN19_003768 [Hanseniaspora menglaensis]
MTIVITNDDGPLDTLHSQYIAPFVNNYLANFDLKSKKFNEKLLICVPSEQKSWISKAHFANKQITLQFLYSSSQQPYDNEIKIGPFLKPLPMNLHKGIQPTKYTPSNTLLETEFSKFPATICGKTFNSLEEIKSFFDIEWVLVNGTPATATDIGIHHLLDPKTDEKVNNLVSGPNVGRNVSRPYITSSGTIGATMESYISSGGLINGIGLSWAYFDNFKNVSNSSLDSTSEWSWKVILNLMQDGMGLTAEIYSVNVPILKEGLSKDTKVVAAPIQKNTWKTLYEIKDETDSITFNWNPDFDGNKQKMIQGHLNGDQDDGSLIEGKNITVTPLLANFAVSLPASDFGKELVFTEVTNKNHIYLDNEVPYVNEIWKEVFNGYKDKYKIEINGKLDPSEIEKNGIAFQIAEYEDLLHQEGSQLTNYFQNSYTFRKSLIRKHYLLKTIQYFVAKNPNSPLKTSFPESYHLELDYAEFLDDSLDENWELRQELEQGNKSQWWIMKPSMSDKGQGIRLFQSIDQLQAIFDKFDEDEDGEGYNAIIINQLRHFIIQKYLMNPLLLDDNRKFHIRCYVLAVGDLEVFVFDRMLCLFSENVYESPINFNEDLHDSKFLAKHLTNTCQQQEKDESIVTEIDKLFENNDQRDHIKSQIHTIVSDLFKAAKQDNFNFQAANNAYEIFGLDFLVDSDYGVQLLECNSYPDFKQTGDSLSGLIKELFTNVVKAAILPVFGVESEKNEISNMTKVLELKTERASW